MEGKLDTVSLRDISSASEDTDRSSSSTAPTEKLSNDSYTTNIEDIEAQVLEKDKATAALEYGIATKTKYLYLALYFAFNLTLTLYNKAVLGKVC